MLSRLARRLFAGPGPAAAAVVAALALAPAPARADFVIDLTDPGASGQAHGAWFYQSDPAPGGVYRTIVRLERTGTERGYNTDARPVEFDENDRTFRTRSQPLADLGVATLDGVDYYKFTLDIHENRRLLSMNDFRLYLGDGPALTGWDDGFGAHSVKVYDLDAGPGGDGTVELDHLLSFGSGQDDLFAFVPVANFRGFGPQYQYVYLYSAFGRPNASDGGFEEWDALVGGANPVPVPPAVGLALTGLGTVLLAGLRRPRRRPAGA